MLIKADMYAAGGGSAPELIWKNPSPYSAFSAQTISPSSAGWVSGKSIDDYDGVIVGVYEYASQGSSRDSALCYIPKSSSGISNLSSLHIDDITTRNSYSNPRTVTYTSNGLSFTSSNNNYNIPHYIWGVKGALSE